MSWADNEIDKTRRQRQARETTDQLRVIEDRLKSEVGPGFFEKLKAYVSAEVEKFNAAQANSADGMSFVADSSYQEEGDVMSQTPSFTLRNKDGRCPYVYVKYSRARHAILWKRGSTEGIYELRVGENSAGYFVGSDGHPRTIEQIGNELLTLARNAEPAPGAW